MKPLQAEEVQFSLLRRFILLSRPLHIYKVANFIMIKLSHKNILKSKQILASSGVWRVVLSAPRRLTVKAGRGRTTL